jgi:hypothetical protein|tara:strand:+ start:191 stop:409 length:219 start_codon:yes stop_codon:yes gene_type:complete
MKYLVILAEEINTIDFSQVLETSAETLRYSLDKSQFLLKFNGETPSFLEGKKTYSYEAIKEILNSPNWAEQE